MCVKEFYGYNCGHCSVPYLRQCPLSQSNDMFPICKYPAERPIFTEEYCHPCSRVLWNIRVLKEEEEHRGRHRRGECGCEVIFDAEERERRLRPRSGKGKGRGHEEVRGEHESHGGENSRDAGDYGRDGDDHGEDSVEHSRGGESGRGKGGGITSGRQVENSSGMAPRMIEDMARSSSTRESWAPDAKMAAYEYVGYLVGRDGRGHIDLEQEFSAGGGYVHQQSNVWNGQLMMGDVGSGMKWYPKEAMPPLPSLPPLPPPLARRTCGPRPQEDPSRAPTIWQKAMSEPAHRNEYQGSLAGEEMGDEEPKDPNLSKQPIVVSSDMGKGSS